MKRIIFTFLVGLFSTFIALQAQAQNEPQKTGTVDVEYILENLPEMKKLNADIKVYEQQLKAQLDSKGAEYQRKLDEYQRGVEANVLLPSVRADKEKELMALQQSIQEFERSAQEDLESKYLSLLEPINSKVQASIEKVAAANNFTYILSVSLYSGERVVLYSKYKEANDISLLVLKDLGVILPAPGTTTGATTTTTPTTTTTTTTPPVKTTAPVKK
ncbi:OmpH family outer membrane protein [Cytophaga aurantiaca]|uniref:OmpH family outer membrane protein n=1 Tax=Cytophaga aurantiaca TaxID=29530 RepID=UPI00036A59A7|nr:OmpH family outer membrane protein [Cytophaga aurantiaca]